MAGLCTGIIITLQRQSALYNNTQEDYILCHIKEGNYSNYCVMVQTNTALCDTPEEDYNDITEENDNNYFVGTDQYYIM